MKKHRHRIHWQLTLYIGSVIFSLMFLFTVFDHAQQKKQLISSRAGYMVQELQLLAAAIQGKEEPERRNRFIQDYCNTMQYHSRPGHAIGVLEPDGRFYSTKDDLTKERVTEAMTAQQLIVGKEQAKQWMERSEIGDILVAMHSFSTRGSNKRGILYYSESLKDIEKLSKTLILRRVGMLLLLFAAVVIVIWVFVKVKIAAPLNTLLLRQYAAGKGDLAPHAFQDPHNEISAIHEMFNFMLTKIQEREHKLPEEMGGRIIKPQNSMLPFLTNKDRMVREL